MTPSPLRVTSVALGDRWLPVDFRYSPFATEAIRQRKMLRMAITGSRLTHQNFGRARYRVVQSTIDDGKAALLVLAYLN